MRFVSVLSVGTSLAFCASCVQASSAFGGVNHYFLPFLPPDERDAIIQKVVDGGAKVIRTIGSSREIREQSSN